MTDKCKPEILHIYDGETRKSFEKGKDSWREIPEGAIITEAGSAAKYHTGDWRTDRAVWIQERCIHCFRCWVSCPDYSWKSKDGRITGVDYRYCKGCGICDRECPVDAIYMMDEEEAIEKIKSEKHAPPSEQTPDFWPHMEEGKGVD